MNRKSPSTPTPPPDWERDLAQSLRGDPPTPGFLSDLSERLDAEYAATFGQTPRTEEAPPIGRAQPAARRRRLPAWIAAAACTLIALSWFTSAPQCSWASMIAAMENAGWVEIIVAPNGQGQRASGWFSTFRQVVFVRTAEGTRFDNHATGARFVSLGDAAPVNRAQLELAKKPDVGEQLVRLAVAARHPEKAIGADDVVSYRVLQEATRNINQGRSELDVWLAVDRPPIGELRFRFLVDSASSLPAQGELVGAHPGTQPINFAYPAQPPVEWNDESSLFRFLSSPRSPVEPTTAVTAVAEALPMAEAPPVDEANAAPSETESAKLASLDASPLGRATRPVGEAAPLTEKEADLAELTEQAKLTEEEGQAEPVLPPKPAKPAIPPRPIGEMTERIDELLQGAWSARGVEAVRPATDQEFVRRVYLDLAGRIPTVNEVRQFLADESEDRRERLIDSLVERYEHAAHLAAVWRRALIPDTEPIEGLGGAAGFEEWLTEEFRTNKPYDQIVRALLLAEGRMTDSGPMLFYAAGKLQPEEIARQASRAFLGVRMDCAQCHDDFFDDRWRQEDFWAFAAFFARLSQPDAMMQRVSPVMRVIDSQDGDVTLPDSDDTVAPRFPLQHDGLGADVGARRREILVDWLTAADNEHFARATANRAWAMLFGRGLVNPLDDMRPDNPAVVPELLDELAEYFQRTEFDLRRLLVTIARTDAYQLSSSADAESVDRRELFAQMNVKPFTPEQLYDGIATATRVQAPAAAPAMAGLAGFMPTRDMSRRAFLEKFKTTGDDATVYQAGITQALTLMNGGLTGAGTNLQSSGLLRSLRAPFLSDEQRIEILFLATVSRPPRAAEVDAMLPLLKDAADPEERSEVLGDALWALLNSAEFTLNH